MEAAPPPEISPQPPGLLFAESEYQKVDKRVLVATGTRDGLLSGEADFQDRLEAYNLLPEGKKHCLVLNDFEHMDFAGVGLDLAPKLGILQEMSRRWWSLSLFGEGGQSWSESIASSLGPEEVERCE